MRSSELRGLSTGGAVETDSEHVGPAEASFVGAFKRYDGWREVTGLGSEISPCKK